MKKYLPLLLFPLTLSVAKASSSEQIIFECESETRIYWRNAECDDGDTVLGRYPTPRGLSFKEQVYIAEMKKQGRQLLNQQGPSVAVIPSSVIRRDSWLCRNLERQIIDVDEKMRKPQTLSSMNYYQEKRRQLSDRRFRECR